MPKGTFHRYCFRFVIPSLSPLLRDRDLARRFFLRQGLWTEGLRTPPGQECSNGSLTFFADLRKIDLARVTLEFSGTKVYFQSVFDRVLRHLIHILARF